MKLLNIISGPIKDGNINGNLVTVILVLINYRKKYLTNFEANANKMKLKSTIDLVKSYPQMLMKPMLRDRLKRLFFLCYASNSIKS
jgi:hypothetical protein